MTRTPLPLQSGQGAGPFSPPITTASISRVTWSDLEPLREAELLLLRELEPLQPDELAQMQQGGTLDAVQARPPARAPRRLALGRTAARPRRPPSCPPLPRRSEPPA